MAGKPEVFGKVVRWFFVLHVLIYKEDQTQNCDPRRTSVSHLFCYQLLLGLSYSMVHSLQNAALADSSLSRTASLAAFR